MNSLNSRRPMTPIQQKIYDCIAKFSARTERTPTYREIASIVGFKSAASVVDHLKAMEKKRYLRVTNDRVRNIILYPVVTTDLSTYRHS